MTRLFFGRAIFPPIIAALVWIPPGTAKANPLRATNFTSLVLNGVNNVTYNIAYFLAVGMLAGTSLCRVKAHI